MTKQYQRQDINKLKFSPNTRIITLKTTKNNQPSINTPRYRKTHETTKNKEKLARKRQKKKQPQLHNDNYTSDTTAGKLTEHAEKLSHNHKSEQSPPKTNYKIYRAHTEF